MIFWVAFTRILKLTEKVVLAIFLAAWEHDARISHFKSFVPNASFLYPLKKQKAEKGCREGMHWEQKLDSLKEEIFANKLSLNSAEFLHFAVKNFHR